MKFYLSLTDAEGRLVDRFRLEIIPTGENPADECVSEDSEAVGHISANTDLCNRLARMMRHELKTEGK